MAAMPAKSSSLLKMMRFTMPPPLYSHHCLLFGWFSEHAPPLETSPPVQVLQGTL
jgi:hypothetical protein